MKRFIVIIFTLLCFTTLYAQKRGQGRPMVQPNIEEMVSNLSARQKKSLETVSEQSKAKVGKMQKELKAVRKKIGDIMQHESDGDQSAKLFPLVDREAQLQAEITKEMYRTKVAIDAILTPEQIKEFRAKLEESHHHKHLPPLQKRAQQKKVAKAVQK